MGFFRVIDAIEHNILYFCFKSTTSQRSTAMGASKDINTCLEWARVQTKLFSSSVEQYYLASFLHITPEKEIPNNNLNKIK